MSKLNRSRNSARSTNAKIEDSTQSVTGNDRLVADGIFNRSNGHLKQADERANDAFQE